MGAGPQGIAYAVGFVTTVRAEAQRDRRNIGQVKPQPDKPDGICARGAGSASVDRCSDTAQTQQAVVVCAGSV